MRSKVILILYKGTLNVGVLAKRTDIMHDLLAHAYLKYRRTAVQAHLLTLFPLRSIGLHNLRITSASSIHINPYSTLARLPC